MHQSTNTAGSLGNEVSVSWISALENNFESAEQCPGAPGVFHLSIFDFDFYAQVTLNSWDRVNDDSCHFFAPFERFTSLEGFEKFVLFCHVERRHLIPEFGFAATDTGVTCFDGPVSALVPFDFRTVMIGLGTCATDLEQTPALGSSFVSEFLHELFVLEMPSSGAIVVNEVSVSK
jgi:hypothetical protein